MFFDPVLAALGLLVGSLVGMTGMGGGALMAPLLIFMGFRPLAVVSTDLAYSALTKLVGGAQHLRYGTVDLPMVRRLALGSVPGALVGVEILKRLHHSQVDDVISHVLGFTLILVACTMLLKSLFPVIHPVKVSPWFLTLAGFAVGVLVGITSVGSGSLIVALLAMTTPLPARVVVGTDLVHAFLLVAVAALAHLEAGNTNLALTANLLIGSIPGVILGSRLGIHLPEQALRPTLAVVLFATGVRLL